MPTIDELRALTGQEVGASGWVEVTQERIDRFAEASGDRQWIHVDPERASRESQHGKTIAHGFLTLSLLSELSREAVEVKGDFRMRINYGLNRVRFPAPVPAGARVRAHFTLLSVEDFQGGAQLTWSAVVESEGGGKPAVAAEWIVRYYYAV
ncbi:MAG TPA: MaoC family dehydratase [Bryobacteraceae bacterium]|nr:MaoC family dehydratase [Bryobacteraceae bacterium]